MIPPDAVLALEELPRNAGRARSDSESTASSQDDDIEDNNLFIRSQTMHKETMRDKMLRQQAYLKDCNAPSNKCNKCGANNFFTPKQLTMNQRHCYSCSATVRPKSREEYFAELAANNEREQERVRNLPEGKPKTCGKCGYINTFENQQTLKCRGVNAATKKRCNNLLWAPAGKRTHTT